MTPRKGMSIRAYANTRVSVGRTQETIRQLFRKYEVAGLEFAEVFKPGVAQVRFVRYVGDEPRSVRIRIKLGKNDKQVWRALYWWLKSQFEAIEFGLVKFEDVFLSHFEWMLPDGRVGTVGEIVRPRLSEHSPQGLLETGDD